MGKQELFEKMMEMIKSLSVTTITDDEGNIIAKGCSWCGFEYPDHEPGCLLAEILENIKYFQ